MKPEQLYHELKVLSEKLDVTVLEHNLRATGIKAKSGLCKVKERKLFIIDKHSSIREKIEILVSGLSKMPHEDVYVVPALRELLNKYSEK
jgi:hypothetical protein